MNYRKIQKTHKSSNFDDFPDELINHVFSFLTIPECERILQLVPSNTSLYHVVQRNIYGRIILYLNNKELSLLGENKSTQRLFKYIDDYDLDAFCDSRNFTIPERFVLSYHQSRSTSDEGKPDAFFDNFLKKFEQGPKFFEKCGKVEVSVDLMNKKNDSSEVANIAKIIESNTLSHNLVYLNLNRFQRLPQDLTLQLSSCMETNLFKFSHLHTLTLSSNNITDISGWKFPPSVLYLNLMNNKLKYLPTKTELFPPNLIKLNLSCNYIKNLNDVVFPDALEYLDVQLNNLSKLSDVKFPQNLKVFIASGNDIMCDNDEVIEFPEGLLYLNLLQNPYLNNTKALRFNKALQTIYIDATFEDNTSHRNIIYV